MNNSANSSPYSSHNPYYEAGNCLANELAEAWEEGFEAGKDASLDALLAEAVAIEYHLGGEVKRLDFPPATPAAAQAEASIAALRADGEASLGGRRCASINSGDRAATDNTKPYAPAPNPYQPKNTAQYAPQLKDEADE